MYVYIFRAARSAQHLTLYTFMLLFSERDLDTEPCIYEQHKKELH